MSTSLYPRRAALLAIVLTVLLPAVARAAPPSPWAQTAPLAFPVAPAAAAGLPDGGALLAGGTTSFGFPTTVTAAAERFDATTGTWSPAGTMSAARSIATAVGLADGSVLVVGGEDASANALAGAERYDAATNAWSSAGTMATARYGATATLLSDGSVLVAGGVTGVAGTATASAERYDPATNAWSSAGTMTTARQGAVAVRLPDGSVLVAGGTSAGGMSDPTASAERYDPATNGWSSVAPMTTERSGAAATRLADGSVLVVGGLGASLVPSMSAERYDAARNAWTQTGPLAAAAYAGGLVTLRDGSVFTAGGGAAQIYDPASDGWYEVDGAPTASAPILLGDGSVLLAGSQGSLMPLSNALRFTLVTAADVPPLDFGEETVGRAGAVVALPIQDSGAAPLRLSGARIAGPAAGDFSIAYDRCSGTMVGVGRSCLVGVRFAPAAAGARAASLVLDADVPGGTVTTSLSGTGIASSSPPPSAGVVTKVVTKVERPRLPRARCSARSGRHVTCTGLAAKTSRGAAAVRLTRGRTVYATGTIRGGRLTLKVRRKLVAQHYLLTLVKARRHLKIAVA